MKKSTVYFTTFRTTYTENRTQKLQRLLKRAGIESIDFRHKLVAIKMHFGERGNLAFIRPNYARVVVELVKSLGGKPFLTDCNTLYVGGRGNTVDHLETADLNGFTPLTVGCHVIIADGLKGMDEVLVPVPKGKYVKKAKIGRTIMEADVLLTLTHFKGHEAMGIGGAVKNIGMGCGSRGGKLEMHSDGKPYVDRETCIGCGMCLKVCAHGALSMRSRKMTINRDVCAGCGRCVGICPKGALMPEWGEQSFSVLDCKTAEYALAVVTGRPHFHISLISDVSPNCDCHAENDAAIVPDIGMLASFDPVALDLACADLCQCAPRLHGTVLDEVVEGGDLFDSVHPTTHWRDAMEHAVKIGLGSAQYELITI